MIWMLLIVESCACQLSLSSPGECVSSASLQTLEFCFSSLPQLACVPIGKQANIAVLRDAQIQALYGEQLGVRLKSEMNGDFPQHFTRAPECREEYYRLLCLLNFPRCNSDNVTVPVCKSMCTQFADTCGISADFCAGLSSSQEVCEGGMFLTAALTLALLQ